MLAAVAAALYAGCGSSANRSAADGGAGDGGGTSDVTLADSPSFGGGDAASCTTSAQCNGTPCIGGVCCADAAHVCAGSCCTGSTVCLFDQCVTPGAACQTSDQCGPGQYCEPALGSGGDGGAPGDAGGGTPGDAGGGDAGGCTSLAVSGRCLTIPPTCPGDAGAAPDGGFCLEQC